MRQPHRQAFAVIRYDEGSNDPAIAFTVKEIVSSLALAESEVARLNALNADKGCRYFWQHTRVTASVDDLPVLGKLTP